MRPWTCRCGANHFPDEVLSAHTVALVVTGAGHLEGRCSCGDTVHLPGVPAVAEVVAAAERHIVEVAR